MCKECSTKMSPHLCIRIRFASEAVFTKCKLILRRLSEPAKSFTGKDKAYNLKLSWQHLFWVRSDRTAHLGHRTNGLTLQVDCSEFNRSSLDETRLFWKDRDGWRCIETTTFGIKSPGTIIWVAIFCWLPCDNIVACGATQPCIPTCIGVALGST